MNPFRLPPRCGVGQELALIVELKPVTVSGPPRGVQSLKETSFTRQKPEAPWRSQ